MNPRPLLVLLLSPNLGSAEGLSSSQEPFAHPPSFQLSYGAGLFGTSGVYVGEEDQLFAVPLLAITYRGFTANIAKGLEYRFFENENSAISTSLEYNNAPDLPDTALFDGLLREDWVSAGLYATHDFGYLNVAVSTQFDISGEHNGSNTEVSVGRTFELGRAIVEGRIGASYLDADQANYLFGVGTDETSSLREAYSVDASWSPHVELSVLYPLSEETAIGGFFKHEEFSKEIADSPLVGFEERTTIGITLSRTF